MIRSNLNFNYFKFNLCKKVKKELLLKFTTNVQ